MEISVELTVTPLQDDYETPIIAFIKKLRESGLKIKENPLSTQVYGAYNQVMPILQTELKESLELMQRGVILMKIVKTDRYDYEPHF